jgi:hypothetical protein
MKTQKQTNSLIGRAMELVGQSRQPARTMRTAIGTKNGRSPRSYSRLERSRRDKKSSARYFKIVNSNANRHYL